MSFTYYQIYFTFTEPLLIWFTPGLMILCMNSYVIYKIINSQNMRPKYLGFQHISLKKETFNSRPLENGNTSMDIRKISVCSMEENNVSIKRLFPKNLVFDKKDSNMNKSLCEYLKCCKKENNKEKTSLEKFLSSTGKSLDQGTSEMRNEIVYDFIGCNQSIDEKKVKKPADSSQSDSFNRTSSNRTVFTTKSLLRNSSDNEKKLRKISVNRISHYISIIVLGFYFILSTIPYGVMLSLQNNSTLKLNYFLEPNEIYKDKQWVRFGLYRQLVACTKLFFISNHCLNFFVYILFNHMFRHVFKNSIISVFSFCKLLFSNFKTKRRISSQSKKNNNKFIYTSKKATLERNFN